MGVHLNCLANLILIRIHNIGFYEEIIKMSHVMRKQTFCICENKDADQLHGNREADPAPLLYPPRKRSLRGVYCFESVRDSVIPSFRDHFFIGFAL